MLRTAVLVQAQVVQQPLTRLGVLPDQEVKSQIQASNVPAEQESF